MVASLLRPGRCAGEVSGEAACLPRGARPPFLSHRWTVTVTATAVGAATQWLGRGDKSGGLSPVAGRSGSPQSFWRVSRGSHGGAGVSRAGGHRAGGTGRKGPAGYLAVTSDMSLGFWDPELPHPCCLCPCESREMLARVGHSWPLTPTPAASQGLPGAPPPWPLGACSRGVHPSLSRHAPRAVSGTSCVAARSACVRTAACQREPAQSAVFERLCLSSIARAGVACSLFCPAAASCGSTLGRPVTAKG